MSAQTKYGDRIPDGHWQDPPDEDGPRISGHARDQWAERLPDSAPDIETVYERAVPVHDGARGMFATGEHPIPDAVRLARVQAGDLTLGVVFVEEHDYQPDPAVVTVYRIASRYDYSIRQYCRARLAEVHQPECDL